MSDPSSDRDEALDLSSDDAWNSLCEQFRRACEEGATPSIETLLGSIPPTERDVRLRELMVIEVKSRRDRGDTPSSDEYIARFPEQSGWIGKFFSSDTVRLSETLDLDRSSIEATMDFDSQKLGSRSGSGPGSKGRRASKLPRQFGDYELQQEVARGGMGVVYRARQVSLNRTVALKMILAGQLASQNEVERFYTEARAAANLDHPGILPIYEINHCDDQHFFTMALVEGGSLADRVRKGPLSPRESAELLCDIADAVHYAHVNGIIHRDLKPANILLDSQGKPKITDFGLAKHVGGDSGMTATGQILGTPSYMPPEQAAGKITEVDARSDVYSLGAVLYTSITGRPPFQSDMPLEVIHQVLNKEPLPPRKFNAKLPLDLEIICLRCLEKDPRRRLQDAAELRDELTRFLNHEPIESRPVGVAEKAWRWCAKRPLLVGLVASILFALAAVSTAAYVYQFARDAKALTEMSEQFERGLETQEWTPQHLTEMERYVDEIKRLAPERTSDANDRLDQRLQSHFDDLLRKPTLGEDDRKQIEGVAKLIVARSQTPEDASATLKEAIERRLQVWELAFDLAEPYDNLAELFPGARVDEGRLILHELQAPETDEGKTKAETKADAEPLRSASAMSRVLCDSNIKMEAEFPVGWEHAAHLGLILNGYKKQGYAFLISAKLPTNIPKGTAPSFAAASNQGAVVARLYRNGVRLTEKNYPITSFGVGVEKLYLTASRQGDQLSFQVNANEPITLRDLFPISSEQPGSFGVYLPHEHAVTRVRGFRQSTPRSPSPLESGDSLFAQGEFREALQAYQQQEIEASDSQFRYEASYKSGLCLVNLKRFDEAREAFAQLGANSDKEWSARAACQLWLIQLRQNRQKEADETLQRLSSLYTFEELATLIPPDDRDHLLETYQDAIGDGYLATIHNENRLRNLERLVAVHRVLQVSRGKRFDGRHALMSEYLRHDQIAAASQLADDLLSESWISPRSRWGLLENCVWIASKTRKTSPWMERINGWLIDEKTGEYSVEYLPLLIERARLRIIDEDWENAEADAAEAYRLRGDLSDHAASQIILLYGFLLERKGELEQANAVWREGYQDARNTGRVQFLVPGMLGSLSGSVTMEDAERTIGGVADFGAGGPYLAYLRNKFVPLDFAQGVLNNMWRQTRGRQMARDIAFRSTGFWESEYIQVPIATSEIWRQCIAGTYEYQGDLSPAQEEIIWNVTTRLFERFRQGKYSEAQVLLLALSWKGSTNSFGWSGFAAAVDQESKAELGYILGCRFAKQLQQLDDARLLFGEALKNCPPDSVLAGLIQAELDKLPDKQ